MRDRVLELGNHQRGEDRGNQVHEKPGKALLGGFQNAVRQAAFPDTGQAQDVFLGLVFQHDHRVVDGDDAHQPPVIIHHRGGDQVILVEGIGHFRFRLADRDQNEGVLDDVAQGHLALRGQEPPKRDIANRLHARVDQDQVIELVGQFGRFRAQEVDGFAHAPEFGHAHDLALHEAAGGIFRVAQRLFDRGPVGIVQKVENRRLLVLVLEVFEQVDHVVAVEIAHRLGQHRRGQKLDHILADALVEFRQHLAVDALGPEQKQCFAFGMGHLFQKVGDVGGVQRFEQRFDPRGIARVQRLEHVIVKRGVQRVGVLVQVRLLKLVERHSSPP